MQIRKGERERAMGEERKDVLELNSGDLPNIRNDHLQSLLMINIGSRDDSMEAAELDLLGGVALASYTAVKSGGSLVFISKLRVLY